MIRECERGHRREESEEGERKRGERGEIKKLKILKEGKRITYILVRKKESSLLTVEPLITVENGEIKVEKKRITDLEEFYSLIAALKYCYNPEQLISVLILPSVIQLTSPLYYSSLISSKTIFPLLNGERLHTFSLFARISTFTFSSASSCII